MKTNVQLEKIVFPLLVLLIVAALIGGIAFMNTRPDLVLARAELMQGKAVQYAALQPVMKDLPDVLTKATVYTGAVFVGGSVFLFVFALAVSLALSNLSRFVAQGLEYTKNVNGQVTKITLMQANPMPALPSGGKGRFQVEQPSHSMLGSGHYQTGGGRKLKPEERRAPDKRPLVAADPIPMSLHSGVGAEPSFKGDPLAMFNDTGIV